MNIEIDDFILYPESYSLGKFNLYRKSTTKTGKAIGTERETVLAYCISLDRAVEIMVHSELLTNKSTVTVKEFLQEFKAISKRYLEKIAEKVID